MAGNKEIFTSPVGRLVQGDCFEPQTKDQQGNLRVVKTGPNAGQPAPQYFVAVAFAKTDPAWPAFMSIIARMAMAEWPTLFNPASPAVNTFGVGLPPCANPLFSFKVKDGDAVDRNGKSNADKEGFAGHYVVSFASAYPPKVVRPSGPGAWETITAGPKRGHYVKIAGSVSGNNNPQNAGVYVNLDMIEWSGVGPEIQSGPDAATAFGGAPAALPPGAMALPPVGAPVGAFAAPAGAPPAVPLAAPAAYVPPVPVAAPPPAMPPAVAAPPYDGFMAPPAGQPAGAVPVAAPLAAPPPAAPFVPSATTSPTRVMTAAAAGAPYENFIAQGWTDEMMIAQGFMVLQ